MIDVLALEAVELFQPYLAALVLAAGVVAGCWMRMVWHGTRALNVLVELVRLGWKIYPQLTPGSLVRRVVIVGYWFTQAKSLRAWFARPENPDLDRALARYPLIPGAIHWPYMHCGWSMEQKLQTIDRHYRLLGGQAAILSTMIDRPVEIARLDAEFPGLRLVLDKAQWFLREGEAVLSLFIGERRIFSAAFTLGLDAGRQVVLVGAVQGSNGEDSLEVYRAITRALHGMRPRDVLVVALRNLCGAIGAAEIRGVSSATRQHHGRYFGGAHVEKVLLDYDGVWTEHGGLQRDDGFFQIPVVVHRKERSELPTRKRAQYRRRYDMLDRLARDIEVACRAHAR